MGKDTGGAALCCGRAYSLLKSFYSDVLGYIENVDDTKIYNIMNKMLLKAEGASPIVDTRFAGTRKNPEISGKIEGITTENFTTAHLTDGVLCGMAD